MAWCTLSFESAALKRPEKIEVLIPQDGFKSLRQKDDFSVLFLLHGLHKDRKEWLLDSQLPYFVRELPLLVVMPTCRNAFYINTENGYNYMDYITKELPAFIKELFPVSESPKRWTIMGESMGGYGSLVCGLHHPEVFGRIVSFSGAVDIIAAAENFTDVSASDLFGNEKKAEDNGYELFSFSEKIENAQPIWMCCGLSDSLLDMNRIVKECFHKLSCPDFEYQYHETRRYGHEWAFWKEELENFLIYLDLSD